MRPAMPTLFYGFFWAGGGRLKANQAGKIFCRPAVEMEFPFTSSRGFRRRSGICSTRRCARFFGPRWQAKRDTAFDREHGNCWTPLVPLSNRWRRNSCM